jgi:Holliday junction resolvase-like predicted endonuclease
MAKTLDEKASTTFNSYHVGIAAESFAAGLLARSGYEVLVQYGANQPLYDLVAVKGKRIIKVSVKGTQLAGWQMTGGFKKGRSYAKAAEAWLQKHGDDLVFMFVQFLGVPLGDMPEVFVARAHEVAAHLKAGKRGGGDTTLRWKHSWRRGPATGCTDSVPETWRFTQKRIDSV